MATTSLLDDFKTISELRDNLVNDINAQFEVVDVEATRLRQAGTQLRELRNLEPADQASDHAVKIQQVRKELEERKTSVADEQFLLETLQAQLANTEQRLLTLQRLSAAVVAPAVSPAHPPPTSVSKKFVKVDNLPSYMFQKLLT
jgi:uncharacterized membrane protein YccC